MPRIISREDMERVRQHASEGNKMAPLDTLAVADSHEELRGQRNELATACSRVFDAIAGHTDWHPSPKVDTPDWDPDAHISVTLTVADCRALKYALYRVEHTPEGRPI